jgi:bisphosphoglycerate-dependent phosphoglycerate mutase
VEILLEHGADPNATNRDNVTPLKLDQKRQEELRQTQERVQPYIAEQIMKQLSEEQRADIERHGGAKALTFGPPLNETEEILRKHGAK